MKNSNVSANSAKSSKRNSAKANKANESSKANEEKNTMTIEQFAIEIEQMQNKMTDGAKKYCLPYLKSHAANREFMHWNEETKEFDIPTGKFAVKKTDEAIILFFDNKEYTQNYLRDKYFINKDKRTYEARKNSGLSLVEKLEKELAEKEARIKEIKENLLPAAREEAAKKKEEAQNKVSEKATLSISKMISGYIATGMTAAEATEKVLKQVEEEAKKATANA